MRFYWTKENYHCVKHSDEARFCFGVVLSSSKDAILGSFERTSEKELLYSHCEKLVEEEAKILKSLAVNCLPWIVS